MDRLVKVDGRTPPDQPPKCPPEHTHSTNCYSSHACRCRTCRDAWAVARRKQWWNQQRNKGRVTMVKADPIARRLQALGYIGYSCSEIAQRVGLDEQQLRVTCRGDQGQVLMTTAAKIMNFYSAAWRTPSTRAGASRARAHAKRKGYKSPLHWADINKGIVAIDDED